MLTNHVAILSSPWSILAQKILDMLLGNYSESRTSTTSEWKWWCVLELRNSSRPTQRKYSPIISWTSWIQIRRWSFLAYRWPPVDRWYRMVHFIVVLVDISFQGWLVNCNMVLRLLLNIICYLATMFFMRCLRFCFSLLLDARWWVRVKILAQLRFMTITAFSH